MPLRAADFESAAYAIPPLRAGLQCMRTRESSHFRGEARQLATLPLIRRGTAPSAAASPPGPMLDSPGLRIAVRRDPPIVEDLRSTTVSDDPVQRRDLILLERARDGDLESFNDLVRLYQDQLFALVVRMVPDRDQASDAVQEAFFSAFRNLTSFRGGSVKSWLNRICVNAAMDQQRSKKRRPVQPYPELDDESWQPPAGIEADPERTALDSERTRHLAGALAGITDDQRAAIVLYDIEGYDYAEIAEMTGVSLGTVKSRIHRGRLALRALLEDRMDLFRG
jgi:RNA polymerase sigma-70 factor (ECF subfamily)